jgi:DNA processing protein
VNPALPSEAYAAALSGFPAMNLSRLSALLRGHEPEHAYGIAVGNERPSGLIARVLGEGDLLVHWRRHAAEHPPAEMWERCARLGVQVLAFGCAGYPSVLTVDRQPPPVLFVLGDGSQFTEGRRVGMVGTRNATAAGRDASQRIATGLASAGVHVVSGLARGVDGWAHRGVIAAGGPGRAIAVVASGLDVVYPQEHRSLWRQVAETGLLISESPPGTQPEAFRFPLRNRIIAALSEILVVVESRERGGSLITVTEASERGIPLMAVPGGLNSQASVGTNNLLREGAGAVVDADDVLLALSLEHRRACPVIAEQRPRPRRTDIAVYEVCAEEPRTLDGICVMAGLTLVEAAMALARLEQMGWVTQADGWFESMGSPLR